MKYERLRYSNLGEKIEFELPTEMTTEITKDKEKKYIVKAEFSCSAEDKKKSKNEPRSYMITLHLDREDIERPYKIKNNNLVDKFIITSLPGFIRKEIAFLLEKMIYQKDIEKAIEGYEYEQKAFDLGNKMLEEERMKTEETD